MKRELPVRKKIRLDGYDYSQAGYYFITMCVEDGHEMLGRIVGDAHPGVPHIFANVPYVELSEYGEIIKEYIENIPLFYDNVRIDKYVIMPNHIHIIIVLEHGTGSTGNGTPGCASPTKSRLAKIFNAFKSLTARKIGFSLWQRAYHDHIIRNQEEYKTKW